MNIDLQLAEDFLRLQIPALGVLAAATACAYVFPNLLIDDIAELTRVIGY